MFPEDQSPHAPSDSREQPLLSDEDRSESAAMPPAKAADVKVDIKSDAKLTLSDVTVITCYENQDEKGVTKLHRLLPRAPVTLEEKLQNIEAHGDVVSESADIQCKSDHVFTINGATSKIFFLHDLGQGKFELIQIKDMAQLEAIKAHLKKYNLGDELQNKLLCLWCVSEKDHRTHLDVAGYQPTSEHRPTISLRQKSITDEDLQSYAQQNAPTPASAPASNAPAPQPEQKHAQSASSSVAKAEPTMTTSAMILQGLTSMAVGANVILYAAGSLSRHDPKVAVRFVPTLAGKFASFASGAFAVAGTLNFLKASYQLYHSEKAPSALIACGVAGVAGFACGLTAGVLTLNPAVGIGAGTTVAAAIMNRLKN